MSDSTVVKLNPQARDEADQLRNLLSKLKDELACAKLRTDAQDSRILSLMSRVKEWETKYAERGTALAAKQSEVEKMWQALSQSKNKLKELTAECKEREESSRISANGLAKVEESLSQATATISDLQCAMQERNAELSAAQSELKLSKAQYEQLQAERCAADEAAEGVKRALQSQLMSLEAKSEQQQTQIARQVEVQAAIRQDLEIERQRASDLEIANRLLQASFDALQRQLTEDIQLAKDQNTALDAAKNEEILKCQKLEAKLAEIEEAAQQRSAELEAVRNEISELLQSTVQNTVAEECVVPEVPHEGDEQAPVEVLDPWLVAKADEEVAIPTTTTSPVCVGHIEELESLKHEIVQLREMLDKSHAKESELTTEVLSLTHGNTTLQSTLSESRKSVQTMTVELDFLRTQLHNKSIALTTLEGRVRELELRVIEVESDTASQLAAAQLKYAKEAETFQARTTDLAKGATVAEAAYVERIKQLEKAISAETAGAKWQKSIAETYRTQSADLKNELERLQSEANDSAELIKSLHRDVQRWKTEAEASAEASHLAAAEAALVRSELTTLKNSSIDRATFATKPQHEFESTIHDTRIEATYATPQVPQRPVAQAKATPKNAKPQWSRSTRSDAAAQDKLKISLLNIQPEPRGVKRPAAPLQSATKFQRREA